MYAAGGAGGFACQAQANGLRHPEGAAPQICAVSKTDMTFDIEFVQRSLPGRDLRHFDSIDTTMREAAALAAAGCAMGTVVIAEEQTAGQGRHGHSWHSEKGLGLYCSI